MCQSQLLVGADPLSLQQTGVEALVYRGLTPSTGALSLVLVQQRVK